MINDDDNDVHVPQSEWSGTWKTAVIVIGTLLHVLACNNLDICLLLFKQYKTINSNNNKYN